MKLTIVAFLVPLALARVFPRQDLPPAPASSLPADYEYNGCYEDSRDNRRLDGPFEYDETSNGTLTANVCINFCISRGYHVSGLEYSRECYCGMNIPNQEGTTGCNMGCSGDPTQACGGPNRLATYTDLGGTNPGPEGFVSIGCYTDSVQNRALSVLVQVPGGSSALTVQACTGTCGDQGYTYAGVEYGGECFCGNTFSNSTSPFAGGCNFLCNGNADEFCGGSNRINIYQQQPS